MAGEAVFPSREEFAATAEAEGVDASSCLLVALADRESPLGYLGDDPLTDFEGVATVTTEETRPIDGLSAHEVHYDCNNCGQCVVLVDRGELVSSGPQKPWECVVLVGSSETDNNALEAVGMLRELFDDEEADARDHIDLLFDTLVEQAPGLAELLSQVATEDDDEELEVVVAEALDYLHIAASPSDFLSKILRSQGQMASMEVRQRSAPDAEWSGIVLEVMIGSSGQEAVRFVTPTYYENDSVMNAGYQTRGDSTDSVDRFLTKYEVRPLDRTEFMEAGRTMNQTSMFEREYDMTVDEFVAGAARNDT